MLGDVLEGHRGIAPSRGGRPASRCSEVVIVGRGVLGDTRCRVKRRPRHRGRVGREQGSPPEHPAGFTPFVHRIIPTVHFAGCQPPRTSTAARLSSMLIFRPCGSPERVSVAGLPLHSAFSGISSPFMRKELVASAAPSPIVTP